MAKNDCKEQLELIRRQNNLPKIFHNFMRLKFQVLMIKNRILQDLVSKLVEILESVICISYLR